MKNRIALGLSAAAVIGGVTLALWLYRQHTVSRDRDSCERLGVSDACYSAAVSYYRDGRMSEADARINDHCTIRARVHGLVPNSTPHPDKLSQEMLAKIDPSYKAPPKPSEATVMGTALYVAECMRDTKQRVQADALR